MRLIVADDEAGMSRAAADLFCEAVAARPASSVLVATGNTPMGMYADIAARQAVGQCDCGQLRAIQLDEYLGIPAGDRRSLYGWMRRSFIDPLGIPDAQVMRLAGDAADPDAACAAFAAAIREAGGIDISVLGLGPNGHLGFNEPPSAADAPTRVITLTEASIESNAAYWGSRDDVPRRAMTVGMDVLLAARLTIVVVSGERKREILRRMMTGPVSPDVPASFLQTAANVVVVADRAAAGELASMAASGAAR